MAEKCIVSTNKRNVYRKSHSRTQCTSWSVWLIRTLRQIQQGRLTPVQTEELERAPFLCSLLAFSIGMSYHLMTKDPTFPHHSEAAADLSVVGALVLSSLWMRSYRKAGHSSSPSIDQGLIKALGQVEL